VAANYELAPEFLVSCEKYYKTAAVNADFAAQPAQAVASINKYDAIVACFAFRGSLNTGLYVQVYQRRHWWTYQGDADQRRRRPRHKAGIF